MESNISEPEMKPKKGISPIWILPIVALLLAGGIAYKAVVDAGIKVTIRFDNAQGIEKGKTRVIYRGMPIGMVKDLSISKDFKSTLVKVEFVKEARDHLRKNTRFWMVSPKVSLKGITGLETILTGNYITMLPGDGPEERHFVALPQAPPDLMVKTGGLNLRLVAPYLGSISQGSGVYYKGIKAGEVMGVDLNDKGEVVVDVHITKKFAGTVKKSTRFYNVSGVAFEGGLSGFKITTEALSSLIMGGIGYFTPEEEKKSGLAVDGDSFRLFKNMDLAEHEGKRITLLFDEARGINNRTQIRYKGVEIGRVARVELNRELSGIRVSASIKKEHRSLLREGTQFWLVEPSLGLAGAKNLETIVSGTYITLRPGKGKKAKRTFKGLGSPPTTSVEPKKGLEIILTAERLGSIKAKDPVYFRQIKVGEVTGHRLSKDATSAIITVNIKKAYAPLVRTTSKFWKASGIKVDFSLFSGAKVRTESMQSILEGGIAFATPARVSAGGEQTGFDKARQVRPPADL
ncbi:MAG: MCE family protein [Deltaproteobacteria bacterium]|nr:MCE family protein [Deltaproteobacteria bacterium]